MAIAKEGIDGNIDGEVNNGKWEREEGEGERRGGGERGEGRGEKLTL